MKKYILAAVTLAAFSGMSFAQNAPAAAPAAAPVKMEKPAKKHAVKADVTMGDITAVDAAANTITVKDSKGAEKTFTLEAGKMGTLAAGAKVKVTVKDGKTTVKEMKKHEGKHEGKKHDKKADAPAPAAAPAAGN